MDCKIRDIELAGIYLAWQHTAFNKPRKSAASFRTGRKRETITKSDEHHPTSRGPIALLNVSLQTVDFVFHHKVCCFFSYIQRLDHCRGPPHASDPKNQMHTEENCMRHQQWLYIYALQAQLQYCFPISDALWLTGQIVPCLSGKGVKGDKQPPPRVWRGVKTWNFHRPRKPASVISLRCTAKR